MRSRRARSETPVWTFRSSDGCNKFGRGGSETLLGQVLRGRRDQVVLATKFGMDMGDGKRPRGSGQYVREAIDASLRRLETDRIDYYWYHRPDGETPIAETLEALDELVRAGKVGAIGASNFTAAQLEQADAVARERGFTHFTAVQNEYSLLVRNVELEVLPACERLGIGFVPFFPLASGLLTGKYRRGEPAPGGALSWRAPPRHGGGRTFKTCQRTERVSVWNADCDEAARASVAGLAADCPGLAPDSAESGLSCGGERRRECRSSVDAAASTGSEGKRCVLERRQLVA